MISGPILGVVVAAGMSQKKGKNGLQERHLCQNSWPEKDIVVYDRIREKQGNMKNLQDLVPHGGL